MSAFECLSLLRAQAAENLSVIVVLCHITKVMHCCADLTVSHHFADCDQIFSIVGSRCRIEADLVTTMIGNAGGFAIFFQPFVESQCHNLTAGLSAVEKK